MISQAINKPELKKQTSECLAIFSFPAACSNNESANNPGTNSPNLKNTMKASHPGTALSRTILLLTSLVPTDATASQFLIKAGNDCRAEVKAGNRAPGKTINSGIKCLAAKLVQGYTSTIEKVKAPAFQQSVNLSSATSPDPVQKAAQMERQTEGSFDYALATWRN